MLVSPHRTQRPWQGQVETRARMRGSPQYDPDCYLCPGNARAGGARNPDYESTFVFENDFAALRPATPHGRGPTRRDLLVARGGARHLPRGVLLAAARSHAGQDEPAALRTVVDTWVEQWTELGERPFIRYVQIFENRGEMMGASNPHPHGQIWANHRLPNEVVKEQAAQACVSGAARTPACCATT